MLTFLITGVLFGLSSGIAPGPILALTISETIRHGFSAGLRVSLTPIFTDSPTIVATWWALSQIQHLDWALGTISLAGGLFLCWLGYESVTVKSVEEDVAVAKPRSLQKGIAANALNPAPYLFWTTVGTPTLIEAKAHSLWTAVAYLGGFFVCIIGSKAAIAVAVARFRRFLQGRLYLAIMRLLGLALWAFAVLFFRKAYLAFS